MAGPTLLVIDGTEQTLEITSSRDAVSIQGRPIETGTPANHEVLTYSSSASEWIYQSIDENVDDQVADLIQDSAGGGLTWTYNDAAGTLTPAYVGDSTLVTTGALNSGSITSGFGSINIGASAFTTTGTASVGILASASGLVGSPAITVGGDSTSGFYRGGTNILNIANAGALTVSFGATNITTIQKLLLASGATVTGIDNGSLGSSATLLATQGAIKTYVDAQVTAQDLDIITSSGNIDIDLDSESLTLTGGTGLDSSATGTTVTFAIDSTVATLSGSQTLTNKTIAGGSNTLSAIANASLTNSTVAYGGVTLALGASDSTPAFNLSDATAYTGDSALVTTGTITSGTWQGTTVAVNQGGTGATSLTDGGVLLGSGTGAITATSVLGNGEILIGDASGDPATLDVGSSTAITILGTVATGVWNGTAIANANLANSTVSYGGVSLALGASDSTPAFNLSDATAYTGDSSLVTVGTISSGTWNGNVITGAYIDATSSPLANTKIWIGSASNVAAEFALSGNATMTAGGVVTVSTAAACTGNAATATLASTVVVIDSTDATSNIAMFDAATGSMAVKTDAGLTYNSSTAALSATTFVGSLTGSASGSSGSCTGNAATATVLATARAINGVDFNGSAPITITAAAGTLTGTELKSSVVTSSLTSVGTIATGVWNGTKVASAYLDDDTAHLSGTQTFSGAKTFSATLAASGTIDIGASCNLYQSATNILKTDDTFIAAAGLGVGMVPLRDVSFASGGTATTLQVTNSTAGVAASDGLMMQSNGLTAALGNQESGDFSFFTNNNAGFILRTATLNVDFIAGITVADELIVTGTGPSAIGGAADGRIATLIGGGYTSDGSGNLAAGTALQHALTGAAGDTGSLAIAHIRGNINTQTATESIGVVAALKVDDPYIVDQLGGSGAIAVAASVYIDTAPTEGTKNAALYVAAGDVMLPASGKLYLDGGGDTYLAEDGADEVKLFAGGALKMYLTGNTARFPGAYANTTGSAVNMTVNSDGDLARSTSSLRYKTDVVDYELDRAQTLIAGLSPISYRHKEEDHHHLGFTAEAVSPLEPLLVALNEDGEPDALEYERLVVPLTAVVQSQMSEIAALTDRIATLEAQA